ncbi:NADPH-dependent FMN reductase [Arthrobacter sp. AL08]|uniref:NADPH-dependent FMN reductase n=1 Tax=unclassified Arthrobacter TaxID=235627 RepID=UPI00249B508F|nr:MULTISPECIES: NADPH-dependent FMN reductase [unclassified Arthrobacter]MDI3243330.1 NADPH-dependent FMN reductase [Arthrobacter sp. AL05]MDI3279339.1 NADPH-dependent FMN reductase [Arthrobacter sp. AL08]
MVHSILLICGSVRAGSVNAAVIATVADLVRTPFGTNTYDGLGGLPHFNPDLDRDPLPVEVAELRAAIRDASALLISTPEYAGAMPGALKNLLEWTIGGVEISGKPTGWINPSTNPLRAEKTYASLATVLRYTDATLVDGACVDVPVSRQSIDEYGLVRGELIRRAMSRAIETLTQAIV